MGNNGIAKESYLDPSLFECFVLLTRSVSSTSQVLDSGAREVTCAQDIDRADSGSLLDL